MAGRSTRSLGGNADHPLRRGVDHRCSHVHGLGLRYLRASTEARVYCCPMCERRGERDNRDNCRATRHRGNFHPQHGLLWCYRVPDQRRSVSDLRRIGGLSTYREEEGNCRLTTRWSGPVGIVAASCSQ